MSYIFDVDDETVWSPALRVGEVFVSTAKSAASGLGCETGMTPVASDMCSLEIDKFEKFTMTLFEAYTDTENMVYQELVRGVLGLSLVMLQRSGRALEMGSQKHDLALRMVDQFAPSMPS